MLSTWRIHACCQPSLSRKTPTTVVISPCSRRTCIRYKPSKLRTNDRIAVCSSAWSLLLPEAAQALGFPVQQSAELALMDPGAIWWPLLLSTLAGLSTAIGGLIAVSVAPSEATLALLLGTAIGVMATVSGVELWWHSAIEQHDFLGITAAVAAGAVLFAVLDPLLPKHEDHAHGGATAAAGAAASRDAGSNAGVRPAQEQEEQHVSVNFDAASHHEVGVSSSNGQQQQQQQQHGDTPKQLLPVSTRSENGSGFTAAAAASINSSSRNGSSTLPAAALELSRTPLLQALPSSSSRPGSSSSHVSDVAAVQDQAEDAVIVLHSNSTEKQRLLSNAAVLSDQQHATAEQHSRILQLSQLPQQQQQAEILAEHPSAEEQQQQELLRVHHSNMLRLGLLMTITLTIHNLPEGFAVAFSAFTNIGPIMALAIALHNIPEGLVIAAPLYAATGSKWKALGMTAASGLSEPLGALLALLVFKPFVTSLAQLDYILAVTGGVMLAVCVLELWPEGRRCQQDVRLMQGIILGSVVMGWTLYVGA